MKILKKSKTSKKNKLLKKVKKGLKILINLKKSPYESIAQNKNFGQGFLAEGQKSLSTS